MALFVVSDLHLGESTLASMFRDPVQGLRFADLCAGIARNSENELVLLGDIFDLTAAHPPRKGLTAFGMALDVPIEDKPPRPLPAIMRAIRENNPVALEALVVPVLERWLKPGVFERFIDAFLELLVENGYLSRAAAWLATPGLIRSRLKDDDDLWERAGRTALDALEGSRPLPGKPPPPDVLVLGHTHVMDWGVAEGRPGAQRLYVNLGTWSAVASDAAGPMDATMPLLRIEADQRQLRAHLLDVTGNWRTLQRFEVNR